MLVVQNLHVPWGGSPLRVLPCFRTGSAASWMDGSTYRSRTGSDRIQLGSDSSKTRMTRSKEHLHLCVFCKEKLKSEGTQNFALYFHRNH